MNPEPYSVLQVSPSAEQEIIDAAYRRLAQKYHPDVNSSPEATERMKAINAAYHVIGDPQRRAEFDWVRVRGRRLPPSQPEAANGAPEGGATRTYTRRPAAPPGAPESEPHAATARPAPAPSGIRTSAMLLGVALVCILIAAAGAALSMFTPPPPVLESPTVLVIAPAGGTLTVTQPQLLPTHTPYNTLPAVATAVQQPTLTRSPAIATLAVTQRPATAGAPPLPATVPSGASPAEDYQTGYFALAFPRAFSRVKSITGRVDRVTAQGEFLVVPVRWRNTSLTPRLNLDEGPWTCVVNATSLNGCEAYDSHATRLYYESKGLQQSAVEPGKSAEGWLLYDLPAALADPILRIYRDTLRTPVLYEVSLAEAGKTARNSQTNLPAGPTSPAPTPQSGTCSDPQAQITYPTMNAVLTNEVAIYGTATRSNFSSYKVQYRAEADPNWGQLYYRTSPVVSGVLNKWRTDTVPPGVYWLRLIVSDPAGNYLDPCEVRVIIR